MKIKHAYPDTKVFIYVKNGGSQVKKYLNDGTISFISSNDSAYTIVEIILKRLDNIELRKKIFTIKQSREKKFDKILSNREYEIATYILRGDILIDIAKETGIAITTISTYKKRIFVKLGVKNVLQLSEIFKVNLAHSK